MNLYFKDIHDTSMKTFENSLSIGVETAITSEVNNENLIERQEKAKSKIILNICM